MDEGNPVSFAMCVMDQESGDEKLARLNAGLESKEEGPLRVMIITEKQSRLLGALGIDTQDLGYHHPVPVFLWSGLDWFMNRLEENRLHAVKKNGNHERYKKIRRLLIAYTNSDKSINRTDLLARLRMLEEAYNYKTTYSILTSLHAIYNTVFRNCKPRNALKELDSIIDYDNYDKKKGIAILRLFYAVAVLENREMDPGRAEDLECRLQEGRMTMRAALGELGVNKTIVRRYVEDIFFPRKYEGMGDFFDLLEEIEEIK